MDDPRKATGMAAGGVVGIVVLIQHAFAFYGIDLAPDVIAALTGLLTIIAGMFVHRAQEDFEALHARVLAELRQDHPPVITHPPPAAPMHPIVGGDPSFAEIRNSANPS